MERDDTVSGVVSATRWTYDTAANGVGLLATVTSPAGHRDEYTYDEKSRPSTHTLTFGDTGESFTSARDYDALGRLWHVTYPAAAAGRGGGFQVERQYDAFSNLVGVQDSSGATPFWQVEQLDGAGRVSAESYDNLIAASRTYSPSTGLVESVAASYQFKKAFDAVQSLAYDYDTGLRMHGRTDNLQAGSNGQGATELFVHDALDRLTCAFFAAPFKLGSPPPTCAQPVSYADNGNILTKGGGAAYVYGDASHPHAVTEAGGGTFAYDAVGNQIRRPGVLGNITYTPFDLPSQYAIARDRALTLDYDGGQERIRKTVPVIGSTPAQETVYFEGLYERVTTDPGGSGETVQHRYYVAAGSATVVVTREEGMADDVAYLHTDALGSVDVITDGSGSVIQRRSYDAFGAKRDPAWGGTAVAASLVSPVGFTGQEGDDELGLVNMRGRIYDPQVGRFLTTDPLVARPGFTQSWNPYSYVANSPLNFTDPSGFEGEPVATPPVTELPPQVKIFIDLTSNRWLKIQPPVTDAGRDDAHNPSRGDPDGSGSEPSSSAFNKFNPYTTEGRAQHALFGAEPPRPQPCDKAPTLCDKVARGVAGFFPGLNSALTFKDPNASTGEKVFAVGTDLLVFAGPAVKLIGAGARVVAAAANAGKVAKVAAEVAETGEGTVSLFRAVGPEELTDILRTGQFRPAPGGGSLAGKQFGLTFDEVLRFSDHYTDAAAIVRADVPASSFARFDFSRAIDSFIFKNGVVTVQPGVQLTLLNTTLLAVEHVF